jgi:hypothetical protein
MNANEGLGLVAMLSALTACGGSLASALVQVPTYDPRNQAKCSIMKSHTRPLIIEWAPADRSSLEADIKQEDGGLIAVRYDSCTMEVLRQCRVRGRYAYTSTTPQLEREIIVDDDELSAKLPVAGVINFSAALRRAGSLSVELTMVGRYTADRLELRREDLAGDCSHATHIVGFLTAGAFEFFAGGSASVGAGVETAMGPGIQGGSKAERKLLDAAGDKDACASAAAEDVTPPYNCGALLRIEVVAIPDEHIADPSEASGRAPESRAAGARRSISVPAGRFNLGCAPDCPSDS